MTSEETGTRSEWVRLYVARALTWPLWKVSDAGWRAEQAANRILTWGERA